MKRAAEERSRTRTTWLRHLQAHRGTVACVCELQMGRFRKGERIGGCGHSQCWVCHSEKLGRVPTVQQLRNEATYREGLTETSSLSNNALERTGSNRGALLGRPKYGAAQQREAASRSAAQLNR
jgi:hypothetical protein